MACFRSLDGVSKGAEVCSCCANLGAPPVAINRRDMLPRIVTTNVVTRDRILKQSQGTVHMSIFVWTVDHVREMKTLVHSGVDGIITNRPRALWRILRQSRRGRRR